MTYKSLSPVTRKLYLSHSCPFLFAENRCAGGDYCEYPPGQERCCCFFCPLFESCPDPDGVCQRFMK